MTLTLNDIDSNEIYKEAKGSLASRIDYAWQIYIDEQYHEEQRKKALLFLIYAFDIKDSNMLNEQLLLLMKERELYKATNPEYIPGKPLGHLPFDPRQVVPKQINSSHSTPSPEVTQAISTQEMLDVNESSQKKDREKKTKYLTPEERAAFRVHIHDGLFKKDGQLFDTSNMIAHRKKGYAAFTLNSNGELSIFSHHGMRDNMAHSSMNAGAPVVAAGELVIHEGRLVSINTHSGHYSPSLFNVYRVLEYFYKNDIDIHQAEVITFADPRHTFPKLKTEEFFSGEYDATLYSIPANEIYKTMDKTVKTCVSSISKQVQSYENRGFLNALYHFKDKVIGSNLTQDRLALAKKIHDQFLQHYEAMENNRSPQELKKTIADLEQAISTCEQENKALSKKNNKTENSGQLAETLTTMKEKLQQIKSQFQSDENSEKNEERTAAMKNVF